MGRPFRAIVERWKMKHYLLVSTMMDGAGSRVSNGTTIIAETDTEAVKLAARMANKIHSWEPFRLFDVSNDEMREIAFKRS